MKIWAAFERLTAADLNGNFDNPAKAEGTFTPVVRGLTIPGAGTYTTQSGRYYRVGKLVFVEVRVVYTGHTGTGVLHIAGLPLTPVGPVAGAKCALFPVESAALGAPECAAYLNDGDPTLWMGIPSTGANRAMVAAATIVFTGCFRAA